MHGFLNMLAAAALAPRADFETLQRVVAEEEPSAFQFEAEGLRWRDERIGAEALKAARHRAFVAYGSCSFNEPVDDLTALGILAALSGIDTTDARLESWISVAPDSDFPIQNLPFGAFEQSGVPRIGVAIGDRRSSTSSDRLKRASSTTFASASCCRRRCSIRCSQRGEAPWLPLRERISDLLARGRRRALARHRRRAFPLPARCRRDARADRDRRLRRLLFVDRTRDESRATLSSERRGAASELAVDAGRIPRAVEHDRR